MRTLIRDARLVVTMDDARRRIPGGYVMVDGETITAVGAGEPPASLDAARTIDARGKVVIPGLVNTHHHLPQTLTRNIPRVQEAPLFRWLLTIGAVLWFPLIQPVLEVILRDGYIQSVKGALILAVQLLSSAYLLKSAGFLAIWFLFLWLVLRWDTQRKVTRLLTRWRSLSDAHDATMNTSAAALRWVDELLDPIRTAREREESLVKRADEARKLLATTAAA